MRASRARLPAAAISEQLRRLLSRRLQRLHQKPTLTARLVRVRVRVSVRVRVRARARARARVRARVRARASASARARASARG